MSTLPPAGADRAPASAAPAALSWPHLISILLGGEHLTRTQTAWAMEQVMNADATQINAV